MTVLDANEPTARKISLTVLGGMEGHPGPGQYRIRYTFFSWRGHVTDC